MKRLLTLLVVSAVLFSGCSLYSSRSNDGEDQMNDFISAYNEDAEAAYNDFLSEEFQGIFSLDAFTAQTSEGFLGDVTSYISYSSGTDISVLSFEVGTEISVSYGDLVVNNEDGEVLFPSKILWQKKNSKYFIHGIHTMNRIFDDELNRLFEQVQAGEELDNPMVVALDLARVRRLDVGGLWYEPEVREITLDVYLIDVDDTERDLQILYTFADGRWVGQLLTE